MSDQIPIYSQVVPKSQCKKNKGPNAERPQNLARTDFDPLNYNHGGNFQHGGGSVASNAPELRMSQDKEKRESKRVKEDASRARKAQNRNDTNEGKVEAYLRQNQVSMRQQQHRHSAVRQAEHRVNLRSLPLNDVATSRGHDRTPTERHRGFPERERDRREHRRERDRDRDRDNFDDFAPLSPLAPRAVEPNSSRPVRKSSSSQRVTETSICADKRRFFCREWAFQKIAHCLEQKPVSKTCGALVLGEAGSGKTALCQELSEPGSGPQARQQRALQRRLVATHFLQSHTPGSVRPAEFVRSLAMQLLSHSTLSTRGRDQGTQGHGHGHGHGHSERERHHREHRDRSRNVDEEMLVNRFKGLAEDSEESSKPLLADSEDQRTDEEEVCSGRRTRTIDRIHERDAYMDHMGDEAPEVHPRTCAQPTNPFMTDESKDNPDGRLYENHENLFLRNISQRQSKELRGSRLVRQSSEPLQNKKPNAIQKSLSSDQEEKKLDQKNLSTDQEDKDREKISHESSSNNPEDKYGIEKDKRTLFTDLEDVEKHLDRKISSTYQEDKEKEKKLDKVESSPPKSRIPVANFKYPNKPEIKLPSVENSPQRRLDFSTHNRGDTKADSEVNSDMAAILDPDIIEDENLDARNGNILNYQDVEEDGCDAGLFLEDPDATADQEDVTADIEDLLMETQEDVATQDVCQAELPEYTNVLKPNEKIEFPLLEVLLEKKRSQHNDVPPPIPSLPVSPRTLIANAYYEKLLSDPEIQQALLPHNLEKNPDECFKKALLFPLLEIDPPKQCLFLLVDGIDEGCTNVKLDGPTFEMSTTVCALLIRHQHLFPQWLLLVCTARKHDNTLTKMFPGFRKIILDELTRPHVSADVQRYVLARLDTEPRLRARVSSDSTAAAAAAAALDHLRIKSDGCLLYLEKVLDGVADGFIALREIKEIPGTLNGLYLWLAQRLFHGRRFTKVRLLLDVLLAARCGVTEDMLYKCLLTKECSATCEDFNRRLRLLRRILVMERSTGYLSMFHPSFAAWLLDVKHCTRRYLCSLAEGHAALAMYYTLDAKRLSAMEVQNYVYHMTTLEQHLGAHKKKASEPPDTILDLHTIVLLWVLDSGCDIDSALKKENEALKHIEAAVLKTDATKADTIGELDNENKEQTSDGVMMEGVLPPQLQLTDGVWRWAADRRVVRLLLEIGAAGSGVPQPSEPIEVEEPKEASAEVQEEEIPLDPSTVHELAAKGDEEGLAALLKRYPELVSAVDAAGGTPLHCAARAGRAGCAAVLLRAGARPDGPDGDGWSALRAAAWAGHTEVVEVLLEFGCDVDCVDGDNRTALRAAAWSGHTAVVSQLLAAGASPAIADAEGRTALIAAAYMGHQPIVRALLDCNADIHHADSDGRTALSVCALCAGGVGCAALLLERGAAVDRPDRDGATPLLVAAFEGHTDICELLLEAEADIEAADCAGRTALWAAASAGHAAAVRLLLFWGAGVDTMDREGRTVLSTAAAQGNVEVVRQLLDRGLDEHHRDNSGWTPLHYAAFEGHLEVCEALLDAGAKVDEADNDGKGALMLAAQEGHTAVVVLLLDRWGAPPDQRAHDGKTALRLAALEGHFDTVQALYERGADVDSLDADRRSTLYALALDNRLAMARYLIVECKASVDTTDNEGRTPLHVSAWQGHTDMVNLLIKVGGAAVDGRDRCARTALHAAAWRGRASVLRALLQHGAKAAAVCTQGATPLGIAAQEGHEECVMWLLQHGADPMQADHCGRTPAAVAWRAGHTNICRLLERCKPSAPHMDDIARGSPELKRRSVHSNSTKSSSNLTVGSGRSHDPPDHPIDTHSSDKANRANLSLSFTQQVTRVGRGRREKERESENVIPEHSVVESDLNLRSYIADSRDSELRGYACERDRRRDERHGYSGYERDNTSPLYASPPRSPVSDICSPNQTEPPTGLPADTHFTRDTHMRIILGRTESKPHSKQDSKNKRNGIVTNPAMRLVANVRNGLDNAAANIRRTGVALAASAGANNPAVKSNAFQWRKETPL